jgi:hypothetical protein
LTQVYKRKGKMWMNAIDIFEVEIPEPAKWWDVEIEENGGTEDKAEIQIQMTRGIVVLSIKI